MSASNAEIPAEDPVGQQLDEEIDSLRSQGTQYPLVLLSNANNKQSKP
jgi:hypothetical protein